ncbi:MAG: homocitrate synthase [Thermoanaerobacterales bacterium]|nr:homocitrate synthase [Thermoanaerobacterales bacterium]
MDTTLRDGEQAPGVAFSTREKVLMARLLDRAGVYQIEAGIPAMGEVEQEAIRRIAALDLRSRVSTWNRILPEDIRASLACGVRDVHLSAPVSEIHLRYKLGRSRRWVLAQLRKTIAYALAYGCRVTVGTEDASRAEDAFLVEFALLAQEMGVERLRYCDTVGVLDPFTTLERLTRLREKVAIPLEFHGHNDFGMATANALAAVKAGCRYVDVTVGGLGERAGNVPLEEVVAALEHLYGLPAGLDRRRLSILSRVVARAAGRERKKVISDTAIGDRPHRQKEEAECEREPGFS